MKLLESQQSVDTCSEYSAMEDSKTSKEGVEILPMDVLCGRGKNSFNHVGNRKFRDIVADAIPGYVAATSRATKSEIVSNIVRKVRESGGRFLKRDNERKVWYVLNYTQSKEKAGHAIRDATITEDSKKQRAKKRKLMRAAASSSMSSSSSVGSNSTTNSTTPRKTPEQAVPAVIPSVSPEPEPQYLLQDFASEVKSLDDESTPIECLSSMLMAHFPEKLFHDDETPSAASFEPLPIDDPFNSYIDQLLGPLTELSDF